MLKLEDVAARLEVARKEDLRDAVDALICVMTDGLSMRQLFALEFIENGHPWATPADLAKAEHISEIFANNLLYRLYELGLAQRRQVTGSNYKQYQYAPRMYE